MIRIALHDFRHSLRLWLCASTVFVAVGFSAVLLSLLCVSIADAQSAHNVLGDSIDGLWSIWGVHVALTVVVGLVVIAGTVRQISDECAPMLFRMALAGATPMQCSVMLAVQTMSMAILGTLVGALLAGFVIPTVCRWLMDGVSGLTGILVARYSMAALVWSLVVVIGVSIIAALGTTMRHSKTPIRGSGHKRWVRALVAICVGLGLLMVTVLTVNAAHEGRMRMSDDSFVPAGMGITLWAAIALVLGGPWVTIGMLKACARLPFGAVWKLGLHAFAERPKSALSAINPMMLSIAIPLGVVTPAWTFASALQHAGSGGVHADVSSLFAVCALPLLIAIASSIMSLIMAGRRQLRVIGLLSLAGASPHQQIRQQLVQAFIATVVASVQSAIAIGVGSIWTASVMKPVFGAVTPIFPFAWWLAETLILFVICAVCELATVDKAAYALPHAAQW